MNWLKNSKTFLLELLFQVLLIFFILSFYKPSLIFGHGPATGGDTGSHLWPLYFMKKFAWDQGHFDFRFWNPGNYYGEPLLVHYFPLPFILMALLSYVLTLADSFNLITLVGPLTLPISIYISGKILKLSPIKIALMSLLSLIFLFDETWSIYGGNIASTLAGQFAHSISLNLFLIGAAFQISVLKKKEISYLSLFFFTLVGLTHAYTFLAIPIFYLVLLAFDFTKSHFQRLVFSGLSILSLLAFFLYPMIDNQAYNTYYAFQSDWNYIGKVLKSHYLLITTCLALPSLVFYFFKPTKIRDEKVFLYSLIVLTLFYVIMYFIFPFIGLVDGRSIPHVYLSLMLIYGLAIGHTLERVSSYQIKFPILILISIITLSLIKSYSKMLPHWIKWNYKSWDHKPLSKDFKQLNSFLRGSFEDPRVAYENHNKTNSAGTIRAFEMLPFFANRSTTEGVYHQSTIVNNASFYLQSLISKSPSCPFHERFPCSRINFDGISDKMNLLGVGQIIVVSKNVVNKAQESNEVTFQRKFGPWSVYKNIKQPKLAEVIHTPLRFISHDNWRKEFYNWFKAYTDESHFLIDLEGKKSFDPPIISKTTCNPIIKLEYNGFKLKTNCKKFPHLIKFAYHSSWRNDKNLPFYKISPGFILFYPQDRETSFQFASSPSWKYTGWFSFFYFIFLLFLSYRKRYEKN